MPEGDDRSLDLDHELLVFEDGCEKALRGVGLKVDVEGLVEDEEGQEDDQLFHHFLL